ncbi:MULTISPECIES: hypothetical protein [Methylosinus]|uniref:hypothetical protein n=1 Tax=Methylosinus TaxID=425 RepID=UPI000314992B|nr:MULTISPECIES: hypothetical protein [Methylosinus]
MLARGKKAPLAITAIMRELVRLIWATRGRSNRSAGDDIEAAAGASAPAPATMRSIGRRGGGRERKAGSMRFEPARLVTVQQEWARRGR